MVKTVPAYNPPTEYVNSPSGGIKFDLRVMTRDGEVLIDFGEFKDLLSYNDSLSIESPAGTWNLKMRASLCNEALLKQIHPGLVIEFYCARNADPLTNVEAFTPQVENPPVFAVGEGDGSTGSLLSEEFTPVDGKPAPPPEPEEADYLDKAPYLLMRGITTSYGRSSAIVEGSGGETTLTLSGESYGKIYRDAQVLLDLHSPTALGKSLEVRYNTQVVNTVVPIYYGMLRHWVEEFWNEPTGWEARTRPIPVPPDVMVRMGNEGSVWSSLQYLSVQGIFHLFTDHTGAIVWEKLPYSSKCDTLLDQFMDWSPHPFRNWEDLPLIEVPSWMIQSWADRLSCDRMANYIRCQMTQYGGSGGGQSNMDAGQIYNMGSIRQYGGPKKMEILLPAGTGPLFPYQDPERQEREERLRTFMDLVVLEAIRWYDRPVQRCILQVRGDSVWRINTRIQVTENWHCPDARPGEYYVVSRSHNINLAQGVWTSQIDGVRDRRSRYLGIGDPVEKDKVGTAEDQVAVPLAPDEYWFFDRNSEQGIIQLDNYEEFIQPYYRPDRDQCLLELESPDSTEEKEKD